MKALILLWLMVCGLCGQSQIASAEYFIDTDPGVGNGTSLAVSGNTIDQNIDIPTSGLSEGVHKLYIRILNNDGVWSLYDRNVFYINPGNTNTSNIASAEYFIDTDPGVGNGTSLAVSGNTIDQGFVIPTTGLSSGVHKLHIRLVNTSGTWSIYDRNIFYISPNTINTANIASAEYFINIDPGIGNGTAINVSGNLIDQDFNVPTTGLSEGVHKLYLRLINDDGTWSLYDRNVFYVSPSFSNSALITAAEYFFDIDPGLGNGTAIDLSDAETFNEDLVVQVPANLPDGDHILYIRVKNTDGTWSLYAHSEQLSTLSNNDYVLSTFKCYPNPVKDLLFFNTNNQKITGLKIINLNGQVVMDTIPVNNKLDLSALGSGTYLFHLKTDVGSISKKIVKQ